MTKIVKVHAASDFLTLVPQLAGFQPRNSIVLVAFRGKRTRGCLRFNLPASPPATVLRRIVSTMIGVFCKLQDVDSVVPVVYTDDRFADTIGAPHEAFMRAVIQRAERSGFDVRDALCVAADGWGSYLDEQTPAGGNPLSDIADSAIPAEIPEEHRIRPGGVAESAQLPEVEAATKQRMAALLNRKPGPGSLARIVDLIETLAGSSADTLSDADAALLLGHLQAPAMRDAAMLQFAFGPAAGKAARIGEARYRRGDPRGAERSASLMFGEGPRPDPDRIRCALGALLELTARAPASARPAPLSMLAWLSWALGRGSVAGSFLEQALAIDSDYGLALLLLQMLDAGHLPEWAFQCTDGA
jgi:hypothetical protein